jgi:hypothetical protein
MIVDAMEEFEIPFEYENTTVSLSIVFLPLRRFYRAQF